MTASARPRKSLDLCNPGTVRAVSRRAGLALQHRLGQNFLVDRGVLTAVVEALELTAKDEVLEIGMGIGTLTVELAQRAGRVVAVDIDPGCVRAGRITLRNAPNVTIVEADALRCDPDGLGLGPGWVAAGNIPYHLTGALLGRLFESSAPPSRAVFIVQREVARRLAAEAGDWSLATVAIRSVASVERLLDIPPSAFQPEPAVHSSVVRMRPHAGVEPEERARVLRLSRAAFQLRRKTLRHGMTRALGGDARAAEHTLAAAGIDPGRRPGTVTVAEWQQLARAAAALPSAPGDGA